MFLSHSRGIRNFTRRLSGKPLCERCEGRTGWLQDKFLAMFVFLYGGLLHHHPHHHTYHNTDLSLNGPLPSPLLVEILPHVILQSIRPW